MLKTFWLLLLFKIISSLNLTCSHFLVFCSKPSQISPKVNIYIKTFLKDLVRVSKSEPELARSLLEPEMAKCRCRRVNWQKVGARISEVGAGARNGKNFGARSENWRKVGARAGADVVCAKKYALVKNYASTNLIPLIKGHQHLTGQKLSL